jgi:hypothetical protein
VNRSGKNIWPWLAGLILLVAVFVWGLAHMFVLRFEAGDVYPPHSSLRADPLGARALREALDMLPGVSARASFDPLDKIEDFRNTTVFWIGENPMNLRYTMGAEADAMAAVVLRGGRLVIGFQPFTEQQWVFSQNVTNKSEKVSKDKKQVLRPDPKWKSVLERFECRVGFEKGALARDGTVEPFDVTLVASRVLLPESLWWRSGLYFRDIGSAWEVIYSRDDKPVVIERRAGMGSVVMMGDSYLLSNEAMFREREPELLAWLVGGNPNVVFDETHLGVTSTPGVMTLVRNYRLHGLLAGLVVLAGLFVWRNAASLVPRRDQALSGVGTASAGKDSATGLFQLLRRNVSLQELLPVCVAEWTKTCARGRANLTDKAARLQSVVESEKRKPARSRNVVEAYRQMAEIVAERK